MRMGCLWVAVCALACGLAARAQSAEDAFEASVENQQLVLRNFSGEDKVRAAWTGSEFALDPAQWHTLAAVEVNSVKLKRKTLVLSCSRHVLVKDGAAQIQFTAPRNIEIDVELGGADPAMVLPKLKDALFYGSIGDALSALPKQVSDVLPTRADFSLPHKRPDLTKPACDCAADDKVECAAEHRRTEGVVPPKFLGGRDPHFTDEAQGKGLDAHVDVALSVDTAGRPRDVWIVRPVGLGLDEEAAKSVLTYSFRPAMCHDKPVSVYLDVDVRFQRF